LIGQYDNAHGSKMELIEKLEFQFERLVLRVRKLEEDNNILRDELEQITRNRIEILERVDRLLKKMQEADID
jgi:archaellum component FlaC